ncbi:HAMP domain-containing protein [Paenibacillus sp. Soil724D2]|uniref:HAMP domain-containing protein n=1 Tax=Paenibacillus sp. (strain Soil724D2) TaxID=1736392 RepID=UPI00071456C0|nr:HAMP domain-containing protein [Paenibacillus sp. Soil724D2]KRE37361.1 hypothetical protein ASG85_35830 [Paenibacillus sp. Soil724D2]
MAGFSYNWSGRAHEQGCIGFRKTDRRRSARIAKGELETRVVDMGLKEFRELARQFNMMGENLEQSFRQVAEKAKWELVVS